MTSATFPGWKAFPLAVVFWIIAAIAVASISNAVMLRYAMLHAAGCDRVTTAQAREIGTLRERVNELERPARVSPRRDLR